MDPRIKPALEKPFSTLTTEASASVNPPAAPDPKQASSCFAGRAVAANPSNASTPPKPPVDAAGFENLAQPKAIPLDMYTAVENNDLEAVSLHLKERGRSDVHIRDPKGLTPLHWAALKGHTEMVELLFKPWGQSGCPRQSRLHTSRVGCSPGRHRDS